MNRRDFRRTAVLIWAAMMLIAVSAQGQALEGKRGGKYRIPLSNEPTTLDPALFSDIYSMAVAFNLYDGLVEFDEKLRVMPSIARRWKISRDRLNYTFTIRKGVRFHNGREVTADDFVYSFTRILSPELKSPAAWMFKKIKGAKAYNAGKARNVSGLTAKGPHTLRIELVKPYAPFLSIMGMPNAKVVPREAVGPGFGKRPVGTGAFRLTSWKKGEALEMAANDHYFNGRPFLDALYFKFYEGIEWEKIFKAFEEGKFDQSIIPSNMYDRMLAEIKDKKYKIISSPGLNLVYVGMNSTMKPLDDPKVRRALNHAVDTKTIVRTITRRGSIPAKGILPPGIPGFDPRFKRYEYDPQKARDLLASAGYPEGKGIAPLEIWTVAKTQSVKNELLAYQKYFKEVGVELVPRTAENWKEFIRILNSKKVPLYYAAWYADFPDADNFLYVLCNSGSKVNRMGFTDPAVDSLLEAAREETDYLKRVSMYKEVEQLVKEGAPVISQHINSYNYVFNRDVKNLKISPLGMAFVPYRKIWLDR